MNSETMLMDVVRNLQACSESIHRSRLLLLSPVEQSVNSSIAHLDCIHGTVTIISEELESMLKTLLQNSLSTKEKEEVTIERLQ